ncbi:MAG TPA: glycoside hydrolase family 57 protein [Terriglobales bacterium]|nr:glycoside hydrolase family 57 protein [Candidatus Sulfotelmatobacter sp.]HYW36506.1 glycoside hydrolase family 57 protein [Terriglobales bacterium]
MPALRVILLWHQHQPFYKDLVTGEYRLPWTRLHALKDYYGMVKLLDEFPNVHQNFNLVPSLMVQIQDYVAGTAQDPFLSVAAKPAKDLSLDERRFALQYLFQANPQNLIGRYPRYRELWERFREHGDHPDRAERYFQPQDFTDLQVLSQVAWFDEFFLEEKDIAALVAKGRHYSLEDQKHVIERERELLGRVLPAYTAAAKKGSIEISATPFYHPILPLVCDTSAGAVSSPGLPLPQNRFRHPEDAREQLKRGLDLHEQVFGVRPKGAWPSEGSVSDEVLAIAHSVGVQWMATDEGVLGRSTGLFFARDGAGRLPAPLAERLYNIHRFESGSTSMHLVFRDHTISDLIGFVYSGMPPADAARHLIANIKESARPVLEKGRDAVISIILDGENAWEYYPKSGREFLRRFYDSLQRDPAVEAVTISEAIARHKDFGKLSSLVPGSWINANFNVWIGAPEDNRAWDYLHHARQFYAQTAARATEAQRKLAFDEILIAEGSDWNWWYGPEHHSANDRDFDELYRKHLSNVYQALGATAPDYLAQPITGPEVRPAFVPQTAYIHPRVAGDKVRYFEWMGAAAYTADHRAGAMHGKQFLLDSVYAGIDAAHLYGRLDFAGQVPEEDFDLVVNVESWAVGEPRPRRTLRVEASAHQRRLQDWKIENGGEGKSLASSAKVDDSAKVALLRNFEFKLPLAWLLATPSANPADRSAERKPAAPTTSKLRLRFSLWQNRLPVDSLPLEGWIELQVVSEGDLLFGA